MLYLIPSPLGDNVTEILPAHALRDIADIRVFICEKGKTARAFLKTLNLKHTLQEMTFYELDKHVPESDIRGFLEHCQKGEKVGLLSEAGSPCIADPGALVVAEAHRMGIVVCPLIGPSSLLLALMGSGMNGQSFMFHGYLPVDGVERKATLTRLSKDARQNNTTHLFIETPYRNIAMWNDIMQTLPQDTKVCVACDLTLPGQFILTRTIAQWKTTPVPDLNKRPAVFLIGNRG